MQLLHPLVKILPLGWTNLVGNQLSFLGCQVTSSKANVLDFLSWLQAWSNLLRAFVFYHRHTTFQLLYYQAMVCDYFNQYTFNDVYAYDRNFRQRMAALPDLGWDRHDQELVAKYLCTNSIYNKGDLHGGKTTMLYLNLSGH